MTYRPGDRGSYVSSIDLQDGIVILTDGQRVPITQYLGPPELAPDDGTDVDGFDWVASVVAGPDADGNWISALVIDDDRGPLIATAIRQRGKS